MYIYIYVYTYIHTCVYIYIDIACCILNVPCFLAILLIRPFLISPFKVTVCSLLNREVDTPRSKSLPPNYRIVLESHELRSHASGQTQLLDNQFYVPSKMCPLPSDYKPIYFGILSHLYFANGQNWNHSQS